jgi:hypothetical protein
LVAESKAKRMRVTSQIPHNKASVHMHEKQGYQAMLYKGVFGFDLASASSSLFCQPDGGGDASLPTPTLHTASEVSLAFKRMLSLR